MHWYLLNTDKLESCIKEKDLAIPLDKLNVNQQPILAAVTASMLGSIRKSIAIRLKEVILSGGILGLVLCSVVPEGILITSVFIS